MIKKQWYILLYHGVGWEDPLVTKYISSMHSPDVFREHVNEVSKLGDILSFQDAIDYMKNKNNNRPAFTFWFDDGLTSVRKYALPILSKYASAVQSVCSDFFLHKDLYWRSKLSVLQHLDGMPSLRKKLRKYGFHLGKTVKNFTMDSFSKDILYEIDSVFEDFTTKHQRDFLIKAFDDTKGLKYLLDCGWEITNHSKSHYPIGEDSAIHLIQSEFENCESEIQKIIKFPTKSWVIPFERGGKRSKKLFKKFYQYSGGNRYLSLVESRPNSLNDINKKVLYRIYVPEISGERLVEYLKTL